MTAPRQVQYQRPRQSQVAVQRTVRSRTQQVALLPSAIAVLTNDLPATLTLAAGDTTLSGHIRLVAPTIDTTTRLGNARIAVDPSPMVRSGMFAEADILVATHDAMAVPVTAVGQSGKDTTVKLVKDGLVSEVPVTTGIRQGGWVEVLSGLTLGDTIVAKAGAFVSDGDKINPIPSETN